ncbi:PREDICTED: zinc finger protein NUTCRACKER [Tarenaya hassleriana]|uniref:zinc finger protein NUTCRACKER n=1 Tax=Tarenaya hassleriana TaxID=28532 RepID=UPI00053C4163|nr:PREDICTED: zinc finger protein NUTCRACKER [Tarenaya hassleriana]
MTAEETISYGVVQSSSSTLDHEPTNTPAVKKKRNLPGNPDPEAEVIALSPKTLMATNRFLCEICGKGFQRDQNLQLHRRGHNLPWKLKQRTTKEVRKRVYVCPEKTCVHNHPSRALGDLTGIKKHFCRKHGEKKWKCDKCSKRYAVQSDWKAHSKTCGTREYRCNCGTIFSRRDSFITHRAFCDALAEETARLNAASHLNSLTAAAEATAGNLNYQYLMGRLSPPPPPFGPPHPTITITSMSQHHFPASLSLWMGSHHQDFDDRNQMPPPLQPPDHDWVFGTANAKSCASTNHDGFTTMNGNISSGNDHKSASLFVPSLFSDQTQAADATISAANMSATALLQKAAQIGATSTDPSAFLHSFALKTTDQITNHQNGEDGGEKFFALFGSNNVGMGNLGGDHEVGNPRNGGVTVSALEESQIYPWKRRRLQNGEITVGGQTRDFLGVGVQSMCHPSSINGWM